MDSITHVVFGAVSGELIAGKKIGKQAMAWGALANSLPDIDVISNLWVTHVESLLTHRGITHSFIFCICVSFFLALLLSRFVQVEKMKFSDWLMIFLTGTFVHIILDSMTAYGTGVFEPFSHLRISLNNIFVADPFYTISLLVGTIALLIVRNHSFSRPRWAAGALIISTLYLCYTFYNKSKADYYFQTSLKAQHIETEKYFSTPTPLNNWLWYAIATTQDSVYIGYFSMFEKPKSVQFNALPKNRKLIDAIEDKSELNLLLRFSQDYYVIREQHDTLVFCDARFGQIGGWEKPDAPFVFRFNMTKGFDNSMVIQQGRFEASSKDAIKSLIKRIFYYP